MRFGSVGYEIIDEGKPSNMITSTSKVVKKEKLVTDKIYSDYKWPYMDSYVPQARML